MKSAHYWTVVSLLIVALTLIHLRGDTDRVPHSAALSELPEKIGEWTGSESPLDSETLKVLGNGVFLNRVYKPTSPGVDAQAAAGAGGDAGPVSLFIGYFPTQRTGQAIHSPQNCLPGAGWVFQQSGTIEFRDRIGKNYRVGDYLISDGNSKAEVLYWYQSHGRTVASDYMAKFYTMLDSIRYNRTDAALIRVVTPLQPHESRTQAQRRAVLFAEQLGPSLPAYIPD